LVSFQFEIDRIDQSPSVVMPYEFSKTINKLFDATQRRKSIDLRFYPFPIKVRRDYIPENISANGKDECFYASSNTF